VTDLAKSTAMDEHGYRLLVENSLGLMCVHDLDGVLAYVSPPAARALGWTPEDGVGRNLREYLAPSVEHLFDAYLDRILRQGQDSGLMLLQGKDGIEHIWEYRNVIVTEAGREPRVVGHAIDVTDRVCAEQALRETQRNLEESQSRHQSLVEGSALGICIQQSGVVRFANRRLAEMHGWGESDALVGQPITALVGPVERTRIEAHLSGLLAGERVAERQEVEHVSRDGRPLWVETWSSVVMWRQAPAVLLTVIDISERKRLEAAVRGMERAEAVVRLAGGVAHEFNNLMTVVLGRGERLVDRLDRGDVRRAEVEPIMRAARKAATLASELLAYSRRLMLRPEPLHLGEVVAAIFPRIHAVEPPRISLRYTVAPGLWAVQADRAQVEGAVLHLVANARDAMPTGGLLTIGIANVELDEAFVKVHPGARAGAYVLVSVQDTGRGMGAEAKAHLFEPFFTTKAVGEGKGLGLPSVYGIVKQHGGYIEVNSTPGRGTEVRLYFPRNKPAAVREGV
jgi:two-component system cell cycle sensor histidine kinase/response regulator CckA